MAVRHVSRQWLGAVALICAAAVLPAACGESGEASSSRSTLAVEPEKAVTIHLFQFQPSVVELRSGATVAWANHDETVHTVTSGAPGAADSRFDGTLPGKGATYTFTFSQPGTYAYFCSRHDSMQGEVRVQ